MTQQSCNNGHSSPREWSSMGNNEVVVY